MVRFLYEVEAAVHKDAVLICDLHLGMESALFESGIRSSEISERLTQKTIDLLKETKKKKLIIVGDLKERLVGIPTQVRKYVEEVSAYADITLVKGNHDGGLEKIPGLEVIGPEGFVYQKLGIFHGHAWPGEEVLACKNVMMGHNHPQIKFAGVWIPAWAELKADKKIIEKKYPDYNKRIKLILMPSFNPLLGTDLSKNIGLGPVLRNKLFKLDTAIIYSLSGTKIGKLSEMERRL